MPPARTRNLKANAGNIVVLGRSAQLASPAAAAATVPSARVAPAPKVDPKNIKPPLPVPGSIEYSEGITPPFSTKNLEDEEDDEDDEDGEHKMKDESRLLFPVKDPATGEEICWVLSKAAETIVNNMIDEADKRNPDAHGVYMYNDYYGYALIELMENRIAEWEKAHKRYTDWKAGKPAKDGAKRGLVAASQAAEWREAQGWEAVKDMWTQMEGFVLWLNQDDDIYYMCDDGTRVIALMVLISHLQLTTFKILNEIHAHHRVAEPLAPIKNVGFVTALVLKWAPGPLADFAPGMGYAKEILAMAESWGIGDQIVLGPKEPKSHARLWNIDVREETREADDDFEELDEDDEMRLAKDFTTAMAAYRKARGGGKLGGTAHVIKKGAARRKRIVSADVDTDDEMFFY
ncbi:hypothetical protein DFH27DRAFT_382863 [Peziza echinospora]|nr:hypothetical protein DFH27DRAFT_382863 [Peziza echinospora]